MYIVLHMFRCNQDMLSYNHLHMHYCILYTQSNMYYMSLYMKKHMHRHRIRLYNHLRMKYTNLCIHCNLKSIRPDIAYYILIYMWNRILYHIQHILYYMCLHSHQCMMHMHLYMF